MPKAARRRISGGGHQPAASKAKRTFAVGDGAVTETVKVGSGADVEPATILSTLDDRQATKFAKRSAKHAGLLSRATEGDRISPYAHPYARAGTGNINKDQLPYPVSKSHLRRLKRKANEQLAGGRGMAEVELALEEAVGGQEADDVEEERGEKGGNAEDKNGWNKVGGKGSSKPVTEKKRKQVLATESARLPHILADPSYSSNPFDTLRRHALNTLQLEPSRHIGDGQKKKKKGGGGMDVDA